MAGSTSSCASRPSSILSNDSRSASARSLNPPPTTSSAREGWRVADRTRSVGVVATGAGAIDSSTCATAGARSGAPGSRATLVTNSAAPTIATTDAAASHTRRGDTEMVHARPRRAWATAVVASRRILPAPTTAAAIRDVSTRGGAASTTCAFRTSASSARHNAQVARCCSTVTSNDPVSAPRARSGSRSRISRLVQSLIEILLHRSHGIVIVHPRRSFGRLHHIRDLAVAQSFRHPQREHRALRLRQPFHCRVQAGLSLCRHGGAQRIVRRERVRLLDRNYESRATVRPGPIAAQVARDREQPRSKRACLAKAIERAEGPHERVLHHFLELRSLAHARDEARNGGRVPFDQDGRRPLVPTAPPRDQRGITRFPVPRRRLGHPRVRLDVRSSLALSALSTCP